MSTIATGDAVAAAIGLAPPAPVPAVVATCTSMYEVAWDEGRVERSAIMEKLNEHGVVAITGVLSRDFCQQRQAEFWEYYQPIAPKWLKDEPCTWRDSCRPIHKRGAIMRDNPVFQTYAIKTRAAVACVWKKILRSEEVVCSLQGPLINRYPQRCSARTVQAWQVPKPKMSKSEWKKTGKAVWIKAMKKAWINMSARVNHPKPDIPSHGYPGFVSLDDEHIRGQCFACVPGSQRRLTDILKVSSDKKPKSNSDHLQLDSVQTEQIFRKLKMPRVRIPLQAGTVLIHLPELVYGVGGFCRNAPDGVMHFQLRVAMDVPPEIGWDQQMKQRNDAYREGHYCTSDVRQLKVLAGNVNSYDSAAAKKNRPPSAPMTVDEKKLHGMIPYSFTGSEHVDTDSGVVTKTKKRSSGGGGGGARSSSSKSKRSKTESKESRKDKKERKREKKKKEKKEKKDKKKKKRSSKSSSSSGEESSAEDPSSGVDAKPVEVVEEPSRPVKRFKVAAPMLSDEEPHASGDESSDELIDGREPLVVLQATPEVQVHSAPLMEVTKPVEEVQVRSVTSTPVKKSEANAFDLSDEELDF